MTFFLEDTKLSGSPHSLPPSIQSIFELIQSRKEYWENLQYFGNSQGNKLRVLFFHSSIWTFTSGPNSLQEML